MQVMDFIPIEHSDKLDYQQIGVAVDNNIDNLIAKVGQMKLNMCPLTADEETIAKAEKRYGITPTSSATLNQRRYAVWVRRTTKVPYTDQWLRHWLKGTLSIDFQLIMSPSTHTFILYLAVEDENNFESVSALLDEVVPTHIGFIITYLYNTYGDIKNANKTYGDLQNKTFDHIRKMDL